MQRQATERGSTRFQGHPQTARRRPPQPVPAAHGRQEGSTQPGALPRHACRTGMTQAAAIPVRPRFFAASTPATTTTDSSNLSVTCTRFWERRERTPATSLSTKSSRRASLQEGSQYCQETQEISCLIPDPTNPATTAAATASAFAIKPVQTQS